MTSQSPGAMFGSDLGQSGNQQPVSWSSASPGAFFGDFAALGGNSGGGGGQAQQGQAALQHLLQQQQQQQQQQHLLPHQQQHLAPLIGQQLSNFLQPNQQNASLNLMLQGMHGQGMHPLQSPPTSAAMGQPPFMLMQQGQGQGAGGRLDPNGREFIPSPNSTPGLNMHHPAPAQTPPNLAGLDMDKSWAMNPNMFFGNQRMSDRGFEDQLKQQQQQQPMGDLFGTGPMDNLNAFALQGFGGATPQEQRLLAMSAVAEMARGGAGGPQAGNAQFGGHMPMLPQFNYSPMPPRPRPEGGQDPSSPNFLSEQQNDKNMFKSISNGTDQLVIDSWTDEDNEKVNSQHMQQQQFNMRSMDDKLGDDARFGTGFATGWGSGPPPANPSGWGKPNSNNTVSVGNWQQQTSQPPPPQPFQQNTYHQPPPELPRFDQGTRGGRGGFDRGGFDRGGRGGRGGTDRGAFGGFRGGRGGATGGTFRSFSDHSQEKQDGKKSAIAETIAMMNKMKMEDQERKEQAEARRRDRLRESGASEENPIEEFSDANDDGSCYSGRDDRRGGYRGRGGDDRGGRGYSRGGGRGGRGARGGGMGMGPSGLGYNGVAGLGFGGGMNPMQQQILSGGAGLFLPPPGAIPPFPGVDGFLSQPPGGMAPFNAFNANPYAGGPGFPYFPPMGFMGMPHPGAGGVGGARGFPRGPMPRGGNFGAAMGFQPRGGGGYPRGGGGAQRGYDSRGRGRGGRGGYSQQQTTRDQSDESRLDDEVALDGADDEESKSAEVALDNNGVDSATEQSEISGKIVAADHNEAGDAGGAEEADAHESAKASKNVNSEQGATTSGQLALLASREARPAKAKAAAKSKGSSSKRKQPSAAAAITDLDLRERLIQQLATGSLECMVCLERIRQTHPIHTCTQCWQCFHMHCIKKWSKTARTDDGGWRCPGCQRVSLSVPREYRCFCGRQRDPEWNRRDTPHSCGDVCARSLAAFTTSGTNDCVHKCVELCHPGPCPACKASTTKSCPCGKTSQTGRCGSTINCANICEKPLNCAVHQCASKCHQGNCQDCREIIKQTCFCGKETREVACTAETAGVLSFACGSVCDRALDCGLHKCQANCHVGECASCAMAVAVVTRCPCNKTALADIYARGDAQPRAKCTDPVPTCGQKCDKLLECGPTGEGRHRCANSCHVGPCPPCPRSTHVRCRCGCMEKEVECVQLSSRADDARCEKRCPKMRSCGRHKCNQPCCIDIDHVCPLVCGKMLSCGLHRCEEACHRGNKCPSCPHVSFDELHCHCGDNVIFPPVACGTRPPHCSGPCLRRHACDHVAAHSCHSDDICPPCTVLTEKHCYGKHETRKAVACHVEGLSCGRPCGQPLRCGRHKCAKVCHAGPCLRDDESCALPCSTPRDTCEHQCGVPCHEGPCPPSTCKEKVKLQCQCGNLSGVRSCADQTSEFRRLQMSMLAARMSDGGTAVDLNTAFKPGKAYLDCNESCSQIERNKRLALALQIENPELSSKLAAPKYPDAVKDMAKKDPAFAQMVHDKLTDLVKLAKESKQKSRSFSFDCMNHEKRQFIHELCVHFGCESESFDAEPKRNVVATAVKDRVWLPSQSVIDVVNNKKKAPGPVLLESSSAPGSSANLQSMVRMSARGANGSASGAVKKPDDPTESASAGKTEKPAFIDYFDMDD